jgi:hypothetical protein
MYSIRGGFIRCNKANSPVSDHHSEARREKWEISRSLMVLNEEGLGLEVEEEEEGAREDEGEGSRGFG